MTHHYTRGLLAASLALCAGTASAAAFDEDFSAGLGAWQTAGDVSRQGSSGQYFVALTTASLTEVDDYPLSAGVFNLSGISAMEVGTVPGLETTIGLAPGAFDTAENYAYEGSALWRTVTVSAGDVLRFDWLFATSEPYADPLPDYAFLIVGDDLIRIASEADAPFPPSTPFRRESNLSSFEYVFDRSGSVRLGFGVVDVGDFTGTSAFAIQNLSITAVPEPSGWALLLGGLGLIALSARRRC